MSRHLLPGQLSRILVVEPDSGRFDVVFESAETLVEAPNWSPDGQWLVVNADGLLWRLPAAGGALQSIEMHGVPQINNDHVIAPEGESVFVSARDGHVYEVPWAGGAGRRVTGEHPEGRGYKNYLHGVSPDGTTLAVVVGSRPGPHSSPEEWRTNVALVSVTDGATRLLTDDEHPDDGPEFSPDGEWIWFSTERFTTDPGHAQITRIRIDGSDEARVVASDTVDWFPHLSPDASRLLYLAYESGTIGHPENRDVVLRMLDLEVGQPTGAAPRDVVRLFGGQGTSNVPGWAPSGTRFACVDYPLARSGR